jgi:hypothetical protein
MKTSVTTRPEERPEHRHAFTCLLPASPVTVSTATVHDQHRVKEGNGRFAADGRRFELYLSCATSCTTVQGPICLAAVSKTFGLKPWSGNPELILFGAHYLGVGQGDYSLRGCGGRKRNRNRSLMGGPVVVHASAAKSLLWRPFCISQSTDVVKRRRRGAT